MKILSTLLLSAALGAALGAQAAPGDPPGVSGQPGNDAMFRSLDTNKDGYVSRDELRDNPGAFQGLDKDGDGRLSPSELSSPSAPGVAGRNPTGSFTGAPAARTPPPPPHSGPGGTPAPTPGGVGVR